MTDATKFEILKLDATELRAKIAEFAVLLHDTVHGGANIGFVLPFTVEDAERFWFDAVLPDIASGERVLLMASVDGTLAGTVHLQLSSKPNQSHRADVIKMMVRPDMRRRGIARALMTEIENEARRARRHLLTLDTTTGDDAEPLYAALGYQTAGAIPDYSLDPAKTRLCATTIMYKLLETPAGGIPWDSARDNVR